MKDRLLVERIESGKWPKIFFSGDKYGWAMSENFFGNVDSIKSGTVYDIEWRWEGVTAGGKSWKQKAILKADQAVRESNPITKVEDALSSVKNSLATIPALDKDRNMIPMNALNNATAATVAFAQAMAGTDWIKTMTSDEIEAVLFDYLKRQFEKFKTMNHV